MTSKEWEQLKRAQWEQLKRMDFSRRHMMSTHSLAVQERVGVTRDEWSEVVTPENRYYKQLAGWMEEERDAHRLLHSLGYFRGSEFGHFATEEAETRNAREQEERRLKHAPLDGE